MQEKYKIERTCANCGHQQSLTVTKREAAFELVDYNEVLGPQCDKCNLRKFHTSFEKPDLDFELLSEWSTNSYLYFMEQDEELLLADEKYLDLILRVIDSIITPEHKQNLLMDALCVIVYDNTIQDNHKKDENLKKRVIAELNKRIEKLRLADDWIMDYIKDVVYPQLELSEGK